MCLTNRTASSRKPPVDAARGSILSRLPFDVGENPPRQLLVPLEERWERPHHDARIRLRLARVRPRAPSAHHSGHPFCVRPRPGPSAWRPRVSFAVPQKPRTIGVLAVRARLPSGTAVPTRTRRSPQSFRRRGVKPTEVPLGIRFARAHLLVGVDGTAASRRLCEGVVTNGM